MLKSEKDYRKKNPQKCEFMTKREKIEELINSLKEKIRTNTGHIETIEKEGIDVIEYSLSKEDIPRLKKEIKELEEFVKDIDALKIFYEEWRLRVTGRG